MVPSTSSPSSPPRTEPLWSVGWDHVSIQHEEGTEEKEVKEAEEEEKDDDNDDHQAYFDHEENDQLTTIDSVSYEAPPPVEWD